MYKRILLPLDGSALAEQALPYAVAQAERFGAELILLKVLEPLLPKSRGSPQAAIERAEDLTSALAREYLERRRRRRSRTRHPGASGHHRGASPRGNRTVC